MTNPDCTSSEFADGSVGAGHRPPRLLVSVRNWQEASIALDAGVDLLDLKEPRHGPLAAVSPGELETVIGGIRKGGDRWNGIPLSMALGELRDWTSNARQLPSRVGFAKLGLAGMGGHRDWKSLWQRAMSVAGDHIHRVAVAYADHRLADAPVPAEVLSFAIESGCEAFLIDTWDKRAGSLLRHLSVSEIATLTARASRSGLIVALAGSLSQNDLPGVISCRPDLIAIRSAVCTGGRTGNLCGQKIRQFKHLLAAPVSTRKPPAFSQGY